jgi:hypothetical protein
MVILLHYVYILYTIEWIIVSRCTWDAQVRLKSLVNGWIRSRNSWTMHLRKPRERESRFVHVANVKTRRKSESHGEAYCPREEAVRQCLEAFYGDGGVAGWLCDYEDATFAERPTEDE